VSTESTHDIHQEAREAVRAAAARRGRRRKWTGRLFFGALGLALLVAFIPLFSILENVITHGAHFLTWSFFTTGPGQPSLMDMNAVGGIANALVGTLVVLGLALAISVPVGLVCGLGLFEFDNRSTSLLRTALAVLIGLPSILFGLFIFLVMVRLHLAFSGANGAVALSMLMIPFIAINCEEALRHVPAMYREAGAALGARRSRLMFHVLLPSARPRLVTGIFLALARASGETAPVLFVIGASNVARFSPGDQTTTLPTLIWQLLQSPFPSQRLECWGIALVLLLGILAINVVARVLLVRSESR